MCLEACRGERGEPGGAAAVHCGDVEGRDEDVWVEASLLRGWGALDARCERLLVGVGVELPIAKAVIDSLRSGVMST